MIGTLLVPFSGRPVVSIPVDHVGDEGTGFESGGFFYALAALTLDDGKEIPVSLAHIVEGECEELLLVVLDLVLLEEINFVSHILHLHEIDVNVILSQLDGQVLHIPLLSLIVYN